jgi:hypothetical protein
MTTAVDVQQYLTPSRVGQGTAVEQSRAIAEVQAAVIVAQQCPRSIDRAVRDMQRSCAQKSLAEKAFFRYSRGGNQISGPSVQLARELARCFGNTQYGIVELRRDDGFGQSEMLAFSWDLETNTRSSTTFIVPHIRDTRDGAKPLTDMRDIYENNANNGARRLREMIFAILPGWYTEDAVAACYATLAADDNDGTITERISQAVEGFGRIGVTAGQLEQKLGAPQTRWTPYDLAQLRVIYRSLERGEVRKEEEFPSPAGTRVTAAEIITGQAAPAANGHTTTPKDAAPAASPAPAAPSVPPAADPQGTEPGSALPSQVGQIQSLLQNKFEFKRAEMSGAVSICGQIAGRELTGPNDGRALTNLSEAEASELFDTLDSIEDRAELFGRINADTLDTFAAGGEKP